MASFSAGTTFTDGVANDVTAAKLAALVNAATPTSGLIQDRTSELTIAADDTLLFSDFSDFSNLKRMTVANFAGTLPTATITTLNSTTGTIATLNSTTGTIATLNSTTGTIATLNSTTGTIPTLVATTLITTGTGTAAAPAIVPTGDTNTGIFFPAADTIAFSEGGAEAMRIDSSGKVMIGTTSPASNNPLTVFDSINGGISLANSANHSRIAQNGNDVYFDMGAGGTAGSLIFRRSSVNTESLRIDSSGNVGVGTETLANYRLSLAGDSGSQAVGIRLVDGNAAGKTYSLRSDVGSFVIQDITGATDRLRIDSSGNVLVGTTSVIGNGKITVQADLGSGNGINIDDSASSNNGVFARFSIGTGNLCGFISRNASTSAVLYNTSSDYRLKENVQPMIGALAKVSALKPCTWTWKEAGQAGEGFIAHEIQEIVPSAVSGNKDETYPDGTPKHQGMDASYLVATLTAAIQEQQAIITSLTERITALEAA